MLKLFGIFLVSCSFLLSSSIAEARNRDYKKAVADDEVVKNKLFPKKKKIEFNGDVGMMLNQSFVNSFTFHLGLNYYKSEAWGFGVEGLFFSNSDKSERTCIETFYNDPKNEIDAQCEGGRGEQLTGSEEKASYGPAYVPIREIKYMAAATATWNPVYGKQLFFMSGTGYFDLFVTMGVGIVASDYYGKKTSYTDASGNEISNRADGTENYGAKLDSGYYGIEGRPVAEEQTNPMFTLGVGQKYHFGKLLSVKIELRNFTLLGTDSGFDAFFALWAGLGVRI